MIKQNPSTSASFGKKTSYTKLMCFFMVFVISMGSFSIVGNAAYTSGGNYNGLEILHEILAAFGNHYTFSNFLADHDQLPRPDAEYIIEAADLVRSEGMDIRFYDDFEGVQGTSVLTTPIKV